MWLNLGGKYIYLIKCQIKEFGSYCIDYIILGEQETLKQAEAITYVPFVRLLIAHSYSRQQTGIISVTDATFSITTLRL